MNQIHPAVPGVFDKEVRANNPNMATEPPVTHVELDNRASFGPLDPQNFQSTKTGF